MKQMARKILALVLVCVILMGFGSAAVQAQASEKDLWKVNVMISDPMELFEIDPSMIRSVTFLDTLEGKPQYTWYVGSNRTAAVRAWFEWENGYADLYFAADGGINGRCAAENLFRDMVNLQEVNFNGAFHTEEALQLNNMFRNCSKLKSVDISTLKTDASTSFREMFRGCSSLETVDVSGFTTENVISMYAMFSGCSSLKTVDVNSFDTAKLLNASYMFSGCTALEEVKMDSWDTAELRYLEGTFRWCPEMKDLDLKGWELKDVYTWEGFMEPGKTIGGNNWETFFQK